MRANGTLYFLLGDHLGSTAITANGSGGWNGEVRYKAWGETRYASSGTPTTYRFTGQREEVGLGSLYDYGARFYSPAIGRFLSADTIVPQLENPQAWNRYSYVVNNPLKYTDPSGHCFLICAVVGAVVGVAAYTVGAVVNQTGWNLGDATGSAVVGAVSGATFGVGLAVSGAAAGAVGITAASGTAATIAGGVTVAASGVVAGQAARATANVLTGRDVGEGLGKPEEMALDAVLGLVGFKLFGGKFNQLAPPPIKPGSAGGPTAGKSFSDAVKAQANAENPTRYAYSADDPALQLMWITLSSIKGWKCHYRECSTGVSALQSF